MDKRMRKASPTPLSEVKPPAGFSEKVYVLTRRISRGKVATYGGVAAALGVPRAARAVGNALNLTWRVTA